MGGFRSLFGPARGLSRDNETLPKAGFFNILGPYRVAKENPTQYLTATKAVNRSRFGLPQITLTTPIAVDGHHEADAVTLAEVGLTVPIAVDGHREADKVSLPEATLSLAVVPPITWRASLAFSVPTVQLERPIIAQPAPASTCYQQPITSPTYQADSLGRANRSKFGLPRVSLDSQQQPSGLPSTIQYGPPPTVTPTYHVPTATTSASTTRYGPPPSLSFEIDLTSQPAPSRTRYQQSIIVLDDDRTVPGWSNSARFGLPPTVRLNYPAAAVPHSSTVQHHAPTVRLRSGDEADGYRSPTQITVPWVRLSDRAIAVPAQRTTRYGRADVGLTDRLTVPRHTNAARYRAATVGLSRTAAEIPAPTNRPRFGSPIIKLSYRAEATTGYTSPTRFGETTLIRQGEVFVEGVASTTRYQVATLQLSYQSETVGVGNRTQPSRATVALTSPVRGVGWPARPRFTLPLVQLSGGLTATPQVNQARFGLPLVQLSDTAIVLPLTRRSQLSAPAVALQQPIVVSGWLIQSAFGLPKIGLSNTSATAPLSNRQAYGLAAIQLEAVNYAVPLAPTTRYGQPNLTLSFATSAIAFDSPLRYGVPRVDLGETVMVARWAEPNHFSQPSVSLQHTMSIAGAWDNRAGFTAPHMGLLLPVTVLGVSPPLRLGMPATALQLPLTVQSQRATTRVVAPSIRLFDTIPVSAAYSAVTQYSRVTTETPMPIAAWGLTNRQAVNRDWYIFVDEIIIFAVPKPTSLRITHPQIILRGPVVIGVIGANGQGLQRARQGAIFTEQLIEWRNQVNQPLNLNGAVLSGRLRSEQGVVRNIHGTLRLDTQNDSRFIWAYAVEDVAEAGLFEVMFKATYPSGQHDLSGAELWVVEADF